MLISYNLQYLLREPILNFKIIVQRKTCFCIPIVSSSVAMFVILWYHEWNKATVREFLIHLSTSDSYLCPHVTSISVCPMEGPGLGFCPELWINSLKLNTKILLLAEPIPVNLRACVLKIYLKFYFYIF